MSTNESDQPLAPTIPRDLIECNRSALFEEVAKLDRGSSALGHPLTAAAKRSAMDLGNEASLRLLSTDDLMATEPPGYLIDRVLPRGGMGVLYGPAGVAKSFVALCMSCSIAAGEDWQGRATRAGSVVYLATEGASNLKKRIRARLGNDPEAKTQGQLKWITDQVLLDRARDVERLLELLREVPNLELVVIDTLARSMVNDESSANDVGAVMRAVRRIQAETRAAVLLVHHCGKDQSKGMRGSSALEGAADCVISLSGIGQVPKLLTLSVKKQKDDELITLPLQLTLVTFENGETSCVITSRPAPERADSPAPGPVDAECVIQVLAEEFGGNEVPAGVLSEALCKRTQKKKSCVKELLKQAREFDEVTVRREGRKQLYSLSTRPPASTSEVQTAGESLGSGPEP